MKPLRERPLWKRLETLRARLSDILECTGVSVEEGDDMLRTIIDAQEALRPRLQSEEPAPDDDLVLGWFPHGADSCYNTVYGDSIRCTNTEVEHWLPQPEAPNTSPAAPRPEDVSPDGGSGDR